MLKVLLIAIQCTRPLHLKSATGEQVSNFEYLMYLNREAGRSFKDLTQYPVFPWVVADWHSPKLDLSKATTFRCELA